MCACVLTQLCLAPWDPKDYSPPGFSVHGIFSVRILGWVAFSFSRGSSQPRDWTHVSCVSCIGRWILYHSATWESLRVFPLWLKWVTHWSNVVFPCRSYENSSQLNVQLIFQSKFQNYLMGKDSLLKTYARTNG